MEHSFDTPPTLLFGAGARFRLSEELKRLGVGRVLLVTDNFLVQAGLVEAFQTQLRDASIDATVFSDVHPDPTDTNVLGGLAALEQCGAEAVVAVGGGSVIHAAKIIGIAPRNPGPLSAFQAYHRIPKPGL